jgi:hypothetical protein
VTVIGDTVGGRSFSRFHPSDRLTKSRESLILGDYIEHDSAQTMFGLGASLKLPIFDNLVMKLLLSSAERGCCLVVLNESLVARHAAQN